MSGWVIVTGPPRAICSRNSGITDPSDPRCTWRASAIVMITCSIPSAGTSVGSASVDPSTFSPCP
jgi:hypothetical protein